MNLLEIYEVFSLLRAARMCLVSNCRGDDSATTGLQHHLRVQLEMIVALGENIRRVLACHMGTDSASVGLTFKAWEIKIQAILAGEPPCTEQ